MAKISEEIRNEMFTAWQEKQNVNYVSKKVRVSRQTADRYRIRDDWDQRLAKIKAKAQKKADNTAAGMLARHITGARFIGGQCLKFIKENGIDTVANALGGWQGAVKVEREASGAPGSIIKLDSGEVDLQSLSVEELEERLRKLKQGIDPDS